MERQKSDTSRHYGMYARGICSVAKALSKNVAVLVFVFLLHVYPVWSGEPVSHIMICCKDCNRGVSFLVNGEWNANHDYSDIEQVRNILQNIKDVGINIVILDMTNPSQWTYLWDVFEPMINNIQQVCHEKEMQFFIFIGAQLPDIVKIECNIPLETDAFEFWNEVAGTVWYNWAQDATYRQYGYGDDRPMILAFMPGQSYWADYNARPDSFKTYLSRFYIGTTQVNDPITPVDTDGWGYRKSVGNPEGTIRYTSPNGGIGPNSWYRLSPEQFESEVQWAAEAAHYSVYGSYDDACDAIFWGVAKTENSLNDYNIYPGNDPFVYYNILKKNLNPRDYTEAPVFLYSEAGDEMVNLNWADNLELDFAGLYNVYRSEEIGGPYDFLAQSSVSNYLDQTVVNDSVYYYVVTALSMENQETGYSNETMARPRKIDNYVYKFDFNDPGSLEGWFGNDHVGGLVQATSLNGTDGVLKSANGVQDIDPRLFYNQAINLPSRYKLWKNLVFRIRQIGSDQFTPQPFDPQGTIAYFVHPEENNFGEISWPAYSIEYEDEGEWIVATLDISPLSNDMIYLMFLDPIGNNPGIGKNFELDYVYLTAYLQDDTVFTHSPFVPLSVPGTIEFENFDLGGVNRAYFDTSMENQGGFYRPDESVDIGKMDDGSYYVGWIEPTEWLKYTIDTEKFAKYEVTIHYSAESDGNQVLMIFNDRQIADTLELSSTAGNMGTFITEINLGAGFNILKFLIVKTEGDLKLNKMDFTLEYEIIPGEGYGLWRSFWEGAIGGRNWFVDSICGSITANIDENWGEASPDCDVRADFWNARYLGQIESLFSEEFTFYLTVNDQGRLWIDNDLIIDAWTGSSSGQTHVGQYTMISGVEKDIRLDYAKRTGDAYVKLEWESRSNPREIVPQSQLYPLIFTHILSEENWKTISVFPNPSTGTITINSGGQIIEQVMIYDSTGRLIYEDYFPFKENRKINLPFNKGVYVARLIIDGKAVVKKIILR